MGVETGSSPDLVRFDTDAPGTLVARVPISGLISGESIAGIDVRPATGELWALTSLNRVLAISVETGQAQQLGTPLSSLAAGQDVGFDFNPVGGLLRVITTADEIIDVNPLTFSPNPEDLLDPASANVVATAYTAGGTLVGIDTSDSLVQIASTGEVATVGPLGVDVDGGGFDIVGASNSAFAALHSTGASTLYAVNLATGQLSGVGGIAGARLGSFALMPGGAARTTTPVTVASEAAATATVTIQRTGNSLAPVAIAYRTADRTATAGLDYTAVFGTLEFAQGETSKQVAIPLRQDSELEGPEALSLILGPTAGGVALDTREHTVSLVDDERSSIQITSAPDKTKPAFLFAPVLPDHLRALGRAGRLSLDFACSERCVVELTLTLAGKRVGGGLSTLTKPDVKRATVRLTKAGSKAIAKAAKARKRSRVTLKLTGVATDVAGNAARRTATLRLARR